MPAKIRLSDEMKLLPFEPENENIKVQAERLAANRFGFKDAVRMPPLVNLAALRIKMGQDVVVHKIDKRALDKIKTLHVQCSPYSCPAFMAKTLIIEGADVLFDDITDIGSYWLEDRLYIFGQTTAGGAFVADISANWDGSDICELNGGPVVIGTTRTIVDKFAQHSFEFLVKLSLLIEAEKTPVEIKDVRAAGKKSRNAEKCRIRYISLTKKYITSASRHPAESMDLTNKKAVKTDITGFIRLQHYGKNNLQVKYLYVDSFEAVRWNNTGDKEIRIVP